MRKTQTKDTIGKAIFCLVLLFLGEGLFGFSLYWPAIFALVLLTRKTYFLGLAMGVILAVMTGTTLGLASLLIVLGLFAFERWRNFLRENAWLTALTVVLFGFISDRILGLSWSLVEGLAVFGLTFLLWRFDYFADEVHLTNR